MVVNKILQVGQHLYFSHRYTSEYKAAFEN